jgi:hypothetical protein
VTHVLPEADRDLPIVVCPLEFERRALHRAGLAARCHLLCCGPGPEAVQRWCAEQTPSGPVILCGVAGSVQATYSARTAHAASAVLGDNGRRYVATCGPRSDGGPVIACTRDTLTTPEAKAAWADRTGADLVDRESAAFAAAADRYNWRWTIVRGVSDGPEATLPDNVDTWVDGRGHTRFGAVLRALVTGRARRGPLDRLRTDAAAAMAAAAEVIRRMLDRGILRG